MRLLPDTHLLLWLSEEPPDLPLEARELLGDSSNEMVFSVASVWEIAIKFALGRPDCRVDPPVLWRGLLDNGYAELAVTADHALATLALPPIHKDAFDRRLVAQATVEGVVLLTADPTVARYPGPVRLV